MIFLNFCLSAAFFAAIAAGLVFYWGAGEFEAPGPLHQQTTYIVPRNTGVQEIADGLEREGIITDATVFTVAARLTGAAPQLKAGEYAFAPGASMSDVMDKLKSGKSILHQVTIPEGWTVEQAYQRVAASDVLSGKMPELLPEGTLRPDTYLVQRGASRKDVIERMKDAQDKLVTKIWENRDKDLPIRDISEFVTLASIVERETGVDGERPHVASVFINRLRKGMRLQSDPTFLYGIYGGSRQTERQADHPVRHRQRHALQHLQDQGAAARPDRQSRQGGARGRRASGRFGRPLLRRRRDRRTRLLLQPCRAQPERREVSEPAAAGSAPTRRRRSSGIFAEGMRRGSACPSRA